MSSWSASAITGEDGNIRNLRALWLTQSPPAMQLPWNHSGIDNREHEDGYK